MSWASAAGVRPRGVQVQNPPGTMRGAVPAAVAQPAKPSDEAAIIVFTTAEKDEIGIRTLVGEYHETGSNHGRKSYQKKQKIPGHEDVSVFLYFWDERDGPAFSGWWFGNQVGGAQVWSRNQQKTMVPPKSGWTIPWDGKVEDKLLVMGSAEKKMHDKKAALERMNNRKQEESANLTSTLTTEWEGRVQRTTEKVANAEVDVETALETSSEALAGDTGEAALEEVNKQLAGAMRMLAETQRTVALESIAAQKAPPALKAEVMGLGDRVRKLQQRIKEEQQKLKNSKELKAREAEDQVRRAEEEVREGQFAGEHAQQLEEMMPAAHEKVDGAEDEVEKVGIAAAPLQIDVAEDLRPVMLQAIKETEQRARAAQAAIGEARRYISGKLTAVSQFVPSVKKQAVDEFTVLQGKLNDAQKKLTPHKTVRQDYEQRVQAKKMYEELSRKLAGAEIEVEKAAMMTAPLGGDSIEALKETENALATAQSALSQITRLIETKLQSAEKNPGPLRDELKALQERGAQAQEKLAEVRSTVKDTQVRGAADRLLRDVSEKVSMAEDELQRMSEIELPFLRGDVMDDIDAAIAEADKVIVKVHTALADGQTFVAKKLIEVSRFTEGPARTAKEEIDMLQKRLEEGRARLQQFKAATADRKRVRLLEEVDLKIAAAEAEVQQLKQATEALHSIGPAGRALEEGVAEMVEQANIAERAAEGATVVARKCLLQKTADLKKLAITGSGAGSDLGKAQTRLNNMLQEMNKLRSLTKEAEERIRVKQLLSEVTMRLDSTEKEVDKVVASALPGAEAQLSSEAVEQVERATSSAQTKLSTTAKVVDIKLKNAQGFMKDELAGMRERISQAETKLGEAINSASEQKERVQASVLVTQVQEKIQKAEAEVQRTSESELPFLKGIEVLAASEAAKAITACEAAASNAQKAIAEARTFIVQKLTDAKNFSDGVCDTCTKDLLSYQKNLDIGATKLAELKKDTTERKRKIQIDASGEKIADVENAIQKLKSTMAKFTEESLAEASADDARSICNEIGQAEQDAQTCLSVARKFLAQRVQEARNFPEAIRVSASAELMALNGRLTQSQAELAKISKQCTQQEQRFVAQKLVADAASSLEELQAEVEQASKMAAPVFAEDRSELLSRPPEVIEKIDSHVKEVHAKCQEASDAMDRKSVEIAAVKQGPLEQVKGKLMQLRAKFSAELAKVGALKKRVSTTKAAVLQLKKEELQHIEEEKCKALAAESVTKGTAAIDAAEAKASKVIDSAKLALPEQQSIQQLQSINNSTDEALESLAQAQSVVTHALGQHEAYKGGARSMLLEARVELKKLAVRATTAERKLRTATEALRSAQAQMVKGATKKACEALRAAARKLNKTIDELFDEVAGGKAQITESAFKKFVHSLKGHGLKDDEVSLVYKQFGRHGLRKIGFVKALQEFAKCEKEVAITSGVGASSAVVRQLEPGELFEIFEGPTQDMRVRGRALRDSAAGWVTVQEGQGGSCLKAREKPFLCASRPVKLHERFDDASPAVKSLQVDEVLELLEGPREEITTPEIHLRMRLCKDPMEGWITIQDGEGRKMASQSEGIYVCKATIAMTDVQDLKRCKVVHKVEIGEPLALIDKQEKTDPAAIKRLKFRGLRHDKEGWVTLKGNQGTTYMEPSQSHYKLTNGTQLRQEMAKDSTILRKLEAGIVMEGLDSPQEVHPNPKMGIRMRSVEDGKVGWVSFFAGPSGPIRPWAPRYTCKAPVALTSALAAKDAAAIRLSEVGEKFDAVEGPTMDKSTGLRRVRCATMEGVLLGWATLRGAEGEIFLEVS